MAAILSGSNRAILHYIAGHWAELIKVSALPFLAILAIQGIGVGLMKDYPIDLLVAILGTWLWVRLTRLYLVGEKSWLGLSKAVVIATLMNLVYWLGIGFVAAAAIIGVWIAGKIVLAISSGLGGQSLLEMMSLLILIAQVAFVAWIICRFAIGLPAVSLGETPRFFADLWGVSRGATWSFAWRMIVVFALGLFASAFAVLLYKLVTLGESGLPRIQYSGSEAALASILDLLRSDQDYPILQQVIGQPVAIYVALLTAECYRRFAEAGGRSFSRDLEPLQSR